MGARDATESKSIIYAFLARRLNGGRGCCDPLAGIEQLLQSLEQLEHGYFQGKEEDLSFLRNMLKTPEFHSILQVC